jgi:hypothetical protein
MEIIPAIQLNMFTRHCNNKTPSSIINLAWQVTLNLIRKEAPQQLRIALPLHQGISQTSQPSPSIKHKTLADSCLMKAFVKPKLNSLLSLVILIKPLPQLNLTDNSIIKSKCSLNTVREGLNLSRRASIFHNVIDNDAIYANNFNNLIYS